MVFGIAKSSSNAVFGALRRNRKFRIALFVLVIVWPLTAWAGAAALITESPLAHADAIVVLGGSANYQERMREASSLLLQGCSERIVLTNDNLRGSWSTEQQRNPFFYERSRDELTQAGVPREQIDVLMTPVSSTQEEAVLVRQYALDRKMGSILIVTSPYHTRRARWIFSRVFRNSPIQIGVVSAKSGTESPSPLTWWFTARGWRLVPVEYVKMIYYVLKYA